MAQPINTVHEFFEALRAGRYTSIGSYPVYFVTHDGETISYPAARERASDEGRAIRDNNDSRIVAVEVNWESTDLVCCHSGEHIESAYTD